MSELDNMIYKLDEKILPYFRNVKSNKFDDDIEKNYIHKKRWLKFHQVKHREVLEQSKENNKNNEKLIAENNNSKSAMIEPLEYLCERNSYNREINFTNKKNAKKILKILKKEPISEEDYKVIKDTEFPNIYDIIKNELSKSFIRDGDYDKNNKSLHSNLEKLKKSAEKFKEQENILTLNTNTLKLEMKEFIKGFTKNDTNISKIDKYNVGKILKILDKEELLSDDDHEVIQETDLVPYFEDLGKRQLEILKQINILAKIKNYPDVLVLTPDEIKSMEKVAGKKVAEEFTAKIAKEAAEKKEDRNRDLTVLGTILGAVAIVITFGFTMYQLRQNEIKKNKNKENMQPYSVLIDAEQQKIIEKLRDSINNLHIDNQITMDKHFDEKRELCNKNEVLVEQNEMDKENADKKISTLRKIIESKPSDFMPIGKGDLEMLRQKNGRDFYFNRQK